MCAKEEHRIAKDDNEKVCDAVRIGWYSSDPNDGGTPIDAVGNILNACGIETIDQDNCNIYDLVGELRQGHRVIVGDDTNEFWAEREQSSFWDRTIYKNNEYFADGANHALIVAGVRVNPDDPVDVHVILTDPGTGDMCIEYSLEDFKAAWEDSNCFMVSTTQPAPYQYNSETHQMEPSQFYTDFAPSQIVMPEGLPNEFTLPEDYYSLYQDYEPIFKNGIPYSDEVDNFEFDVPINLSSHIHGYSIIPFDNDIMSQNNDCPLSNDDNFDEYEDDTIDIN